MRYLASILILTVIVGLGFVGLSHYVDTAYGQTSSSLVTTGTAAGASTANGAQVLGLLTRLQSITLDGSVFKTPAFQSLQDFSVTITPKPVGRPNPYLPINGGVTVNTTAPKTTAPGTSSGPLFLLTQ